MNSLSEMPAETKCWCGWYALGKCPNGCPTDKTCKDKMATACPECGSTKGLPHLPLYHRIRCSKIKETE